MRKAVALLVIASAVVGCGQTPEETVRESLTEYYEALIDERHDEVCDRMTRATRQAVVKRAQELRPDLPSERRVIRCEAAIPILANPGPPVVSDRGTEWRDALKKLPAARVRVTGERATVHHKPGEPSQLLREDGGWKIAQRSESRSWPP